MYSRVTGNENEDAERGEVAWIALFVAADVNTRQQLSDQDQDCRNEVEDLRR